MSIVRGFLEKPVPRQSTEKMNILLMNNDLRPKRSAALPKKSRKEPHVSLKKILDCFSSLKEG